MATGHTAGEQRPARVGASTVVFASVHGHAQSTVILGAPAHPPSPIKKSPSS